MAKRRFRTPSPTTERRLSPEERRDRRRKERESGSRAKRSAGRTPPWRRAALLGIPVVVIAAVVAILLFGNLFATPCLNFQPIPSGSGVPAFPPRNTTDFSRTWCPSGASAQFQVYPYLRIQINGQNVGIPPTQSASATNPDWPSIGRNSSYPNQYACDLPIATRPPAPSQGFPDGVIYVVSPWPYLYNLSTFFDVWSQSFATVQVNATATSQPIVYTSSDLLGYTSDATHSISLFVDGQPSSAGPGLVLNYLDYASNPYPSCLAQKYGTGHTILLTYQSIAPAVRNGSGLLPATLATHGPDPAPYLASYGGPLANVGADPGAAAAHARAGLASLAWLVLRPIGG